MAIREERGNRHFTLECPFTGELKIDQSVAHNGVCLTVVELDGSRYTVTAIRETLLKSNLGGLTEGDLDQSGGAVCGPTRAGRSYRAGA